MINLGRTEHTDKIPETSQFYIFLLNVVQEGSQRKLAWSKYYSKSIWTAKHYCFYRTWRKIWDYSTLIVPTTFDLGSPCTCTSACPDVLHVKQCVQRHQDGKAAETAINMSKLTFEIPKTIMSWKLWTLLSNRPVEKTTKQMSHTWLRISQYFSSMIILSETLFSYSGMHFWKGTTMRTVTDTAYGTDDCDQEELRSDIRERSTNSDIGYFI